jgi:RIO kinase 1
MAKISKEKWKVYGNVFDQFTNRLLFKLGSQGHFLELKSPISIGKEANVFSAVKEDGSLVIVKIYRLENCNFNQMYSYIRQDPRYMHVKKRKREIVFAWAQREYRNILKAREAGVRVPTVFAVAKHVLVMEYIGGKDVACQAKDDMPSSLKKRKEYFATWVDYMKKMWKKAGIVHGDLSKYNVLTDKDKPVFIDFSQGSSTESGNAVELLVRDVKNLCAFASKCGVELDAKKTVEEIMEC